jgi:hypothetical protein
MQEDTLPLYAQRIAGRMKAESGLLNKRITFSLLVPDRVPVECVWLDPGFGFFAIKGREKEGYLTVKDLPEGSLIFNQRYEDDENK